jgi:hypothetical protein
MAALAFVAPHSCFLAAFFYIRRCVDDISQWPLQGVHGLKDLSNSARGTFNRSCLIPCVTLTLMPQTLIARLDAYNHL